MTKSFMVKLPKGPQESAGGYIVVACPKCGKRTYGVAGQKGKKCPVCDAKMPADAGTCPECNEPLC